MKSIVKWWKDSPKVRFAARTVGAAAAGYIVNAVRSGEAWTLQSLASGAATAAITAILGLIVLEPKVGINKTEVKG